MVENKDIGKAVKEIKGKRRSLVVSGNDQDRNPRLGKVHKRSDQFVEGIPRDIVFVEEIAAVDEEIGFCFQSVFHYAEKILKNGLRPFSAPFGVGYG
jgi:hypothetical protein